MGFQIVVAGETQCENFAQACLIADYLTQNLPNFCYRRIEKPVLEWKAWLCKINQKNNWHHVGTPLIWKELLMDGSKAYYIGGASEFLEYCYSYYNFDTFIASERFEDLINNFNQLQRKYKHEQNVTYLQAESIVEDKNFKKYLSVCISGAANPLTMHLISGLVDLSFGGREFNKIYIYDEKHDNLPFLEFVERECNYVRTNYPSKVVKCVEKIGLALTNSDLLIVLDHIPYKIDYSIGNWLHKNKKIMESLAIMINASAPPKMCIMLPNLGPACYNATVLRNKVTNINKNNIVVATSDLGLDVAPIAAKLAEVPLRNIFCPPVWGFVGINHLVDIMNTTHIYNRFDPFTRFSKVKNSSLCIGTLIPEIRRMEYLMYFDENLWTKVSENNVKSAKRDTGKAIAVLNVVQLWFFDHNPNYITPLGIHCDGSFGLSFDGIFSQPANFVDGEWKPASRFLQPRDPNINIEYLEKIAKITLNLGKQDLPHNHSSE